MDHGSRAFVQGVISIWTKRMDCVHFSNKKIFGLKIFWKCGCPNFLFISYLFFFSLILGFLVGFFFFVFLLFCTFHTPLHIMDERKKQILVVIAMYWRFVCVDSTSVEHSSLGSRVWNGEVCIVCSNVGIHGEENVNCLGFWKVLGFGRLLYWFLIGSYIENLFKQWLGFLIGHFNIFVKIWVHIWENSWEIQFWWKIELQCLWYSYEVGMVKVLSKEFEALCRIS